MLHMLHTVCDGCGCHFCFVAVAVGKWDHCGGRCVRVTDCHGHILQNQNVSPQFFMDNFDHVWAENATVNAAR